MVRARPAAHLRRARVAVALLFVINAAVYATVVPRLPAIKADLDLSNTALGTAVAAMPAGALLSGLAASRLIARFGSGWVGPVCALGFALVLPGFALAPSWAALAGVFLVLGLLDSVMDVSMNAHALRVQRGYERSIVNALHGLWSIGAVLGSLAAAGAAAADVSLTRHLGVAAVVVAVAAATAARLVLPGHDDVEREDLSGPAAGATPEPEEGHRAAVDGRGRSGAGRRLALLGLVVVLAAVIEDAPASWGAVLLRTELGTGAAAAGLVFLGFQAAMTVSRLTGDRLVDRFGRVEVVRASGLVVTGAVALGLAVGEPAAVVAGFTVAGLGAASLFPLVFHAAGNLPGVSTGHGVAVVAWLSRVGFLVVPPTVGAVGDATSLRLGLAIVPVAGLAVAALAGTLADDRG